MWIDEWNALQHPVAAAFLAVVYSDYMLTTRTSEVSCNGQSFSPTDLRKFAASQVIVLFSFFPLFFRFRRFIRKSLKK